MSDPFAPPAESADDAPLADLGSRFVGALIDNVVILGPLLVAGFLAIPFMPEDPDAPPPVPVLILAGLGGLALIAIGLYQWVQISTTGQSIGKGIVGTRIVKVDGSPVDFVTGVILRSWITGAVMGVANQCCLGWVVMLVDVLPIFGPERRCVHDLIAGTKVVVAT